MRFYLGTHETSWLSRLNIPLFVSDRRLRARKTMPIARTNWALDSGGFTELSTYGNWDNGPTPAEYAVTVRRYAEEIGRLDWAAPQDWMCEPWITAKTGLTVAEHQARTVGNYIDLKSIDPQLPVIPVIQGWELRDYLACIQRYHQAGIDLRTEPVVGLGSVCRRQSGEQIADLVCELADMGLSLHGFGVKTAGLSVYGYWLASADSLAWSYRARRNPKIPGHTHKSCANCAEYALNWRSNVLSQISSRSYQPSLFGAGVDW